MIRTMFLLHAAKYNAHAEIQNCSFTNLEKDTNFGVTSGLMEHPTMTTK